MPRTRGDRPEVLASLTTFGLQRIDVLVGPAMAEVNAMLAELRTKRDELVAAIGNISNLVTQAELATAMEGLTKEGLGLGNVDNVSAASLRARATHTGTQDMATVEGLADALAEKQVALIEAGTITANTTAQAGRVYDCDTSAAAFTLTLPATPAAGARVGVRDIARTFDTKNLTLARNGQRIEGQLEDLTADTVLRAVFIFKGAARGWVAEQLT